MSGSGKGLIGLWLYRMGDSTDWTLKEGIPGKSRGVRFGKLKSNDLATSEGFLFFEN